MSVSQIEIGSRLAGWRKKKGYSQKDLAVFLELPRSSIAQMELGKRNISVTEIIRLSEVLGFSLDGFLAREYAVDNVEIKAEEANPEYQAIRLSVPLLDKNKLTNVLLYLLEKCAGKPNVGETVLYKLLYFSDFNFYEMYEEHLTGSQYRKLPYGPVPQKIGDIIGQMMETGQLMRVKSTYRGMPQTRYLPLVKPDLMKMTAAEKMVMDRVIERFSDWSATAISEYSHGDMPWRATGEGEIIDYELVFYRDTPYSMRTYDEEQEMK